MAIEGRSTAEGTASYRDRFGGKIPPAHFRSLDGLSVGPVGIGTYLGLHDDETDAAYEEAIAETLKLGGNLIDTAINYRCMRSEKAVGRVLERLFGEGRFGREEVAVCTKGGYIPFDGDVPANIRDYIRDTYIETGVVDNDDLVGSCHAMTPRFLERQITRSLKNLRLGTIDVYYLHNPEVHRAVLPRPVFLDRLLRAFRFLEEEAARGRIARYGISSWEAFRAEPASPVYLSLADLVRLAEEAGGKDHHFAVIQIPFNVAMMEGFALVSQEIKGEYLSSIDGASKLGLAVTISAPFLQGRLLAEFPDFLAEGMKEFGSNAERAIQFARSFPGVTSVLAGMSRAVHVAENLAVARRAPLTQKELFALFPTG